ncbi:MAG: hypothetical protein ABFD63_04375, partial [Smithella sp.]
MPGMVYIHGYQNNRETGDAYSIETARRGIVVLNIDAIGRGHSGLPGEPSDPGFDPTYGGKSAIAFLKSLPYVRPDAVGIMGHSSFFFRRRLSSGRACPGKSFHSAPAFFDHFTQGNAFQKVFIAEA